MPGWKRTIKLKDLLTDGDGDPDEEAIAVGKKMAERLREVKTIPGWQDFANSFDNVRGEGGFNRVDRVYDIADRERIWID